MVCLCAVGGRLSIAPSSLPLDTRLDEAAHLYAQGNYGDAAEKYHDILTSSPHQPDALQMLGVLAQRANKTELALALFEEALVARPLFPQARYNRGVVLRLMGRDTEAMMSAQMAVDTDPNLAAGWDLMGQIYKDKGDKEQAAACYKRAISLQPQNPHFYGNYGLLLFTQGDLNAAYQAAQQAERLDPNFPPMLLGNVLLALGYPEQAAKKFARARVLRPGFQDGAANEAMARLQIGDMEQGWALWEKRPDLLPEHEAQLRNISLWQGQEIDHLILYEDQGLGDAIQFLRYVPSVKTRAKKITLRIREPLRDLCMENFSYVTVSGGDEPVVEEYNLTPVARCRLSSLPFFFGTRMNNVPPTPYLVAPVEKRALWRERVKNVSRPRIGLIWAGNVNFRNDARRSVVLSAFAPLIQNAASHLVSLQKDKRDESATFFDPTDDLQNFADTAALIAELDLVISVDTASAHLAGSMGKPVWILLPFISDWRWMLGRCSSPWYKSARLFRQKKPGDWGGVIQTVSDEVRKLLAGDKTVLAPIVGQEPCLRQHPDALPLPS
jgi:tetratricopeptide (TPR) repeat protein